MKLTLQTQLFPDQEQAKKLVATMEAFNAAANWLAGEAFNLQSANKVKLQQLYYQELRKRFGLSAQMAVRCIAQVCEAFSRDRSKRPHFRKDASMPYDQRLMSFKSVDRVSLLTLEGRVVLPVVMGKYQEKRFHHKHGQCDLVRRKDGKWFLLVTVDLPDGTPIPTTDFIGVDFGVVNIATDSDGQIHTSAETETVRRHYRKVRGSLQKKAARQKKTGQRPKKVRRKLKDLSGKERRFKADTNHTISKRIVEKATDTGRGIGLEELTGIRDRTRFRHEQRDQMSKWSFAELRGFIEYKARLAGVPVVAIDPHNTSKACPECGHIDKVNRLVRGIFLCRECGHFDHADVVGAINIASAAKVAWREVAVKAAA
ncbi:MAG: transposase [Acidobacteria bacterium]|nr:transposase [Acidobacteriota bacterium]